MQIYIPSRARATLCRTWQGLPPAARAHAVHVVPKDELTAYEAQGLPCVPCPAKGIGPTRQWICEIHPQAKKGKRLLMLDDDLEFFERRKDDATKLIRADAKSVTQMLRELDTLSKFYAHGGIATREGANRNTDDVLYNERCLRALFYNVEVMEQHGIRFDRIPVMEDFDVALQLLEIGAMSAKLNSWAQDQPGSNTAGGCSTYRTAVVQAAGAKGLARLHPNSVTVVEKPPLKSGGWSGQPRLDVRVAWKKAYNNAR